MTPGRYILARIAQSFGIMRRSKRLGDAASETHLLREAEEILGSKVWQGVGEVDELSVEYWNLRKIDKEHQELSAKMKAAEELLAKSHGERAELLNEVSELQQQLEQQRLEVMQEVEQFATRRDQIVSEAREVRRQYDGIKVKIAVLAAEGADASGDQEARSRAKMLELREKFQALREQRVAIGGQIEEGDRKLLEVEAKLEEHRRKRREDASHTFQLIGQANREISNYRAQLGLVETRRQQLFGEIGRYVSRHARDNPALAKVYRGQSDMIDVMSALRRSIIMNRKLSGPD